MKFRETRFVSSFADMLILIRPCHCERSPETKGSPSLRGKLIGNFLFLLRERRADGAVGKVEENARFGSIFFCARGTLD